MIQENLSENNSMGFADDAIALASVTANVLELKDAYRIDFSAPGLANQKLEAKVNNGLLVIASKEKNNEATTSYLRMIKAPEDIENTKPEINYSGGIISVKLIKSQIKKLVY